VPSNGEGQEQLWYIPLLACFDAHPTRNAQRNFGTSVTCLFWHSPNRDGLEKLLYILLLDHSDAHPTGKAVTFHYIAVMMPHPTWKAIAFSYISILMSHQTKKAKNSSNTSNFHPDTWEMNEKYILKKKMF
jgi:hypothetical protein